jgi:hypothetical protein
LHIAVRRGLGARQRFEHFALRLGDLQGRAWSAHDSSYRQPPLLSMTDH